MITAIDLLDELQHIEKPNARLSMIVNSELPGCFRFCAQWFEDGACRTVYSEYVTTDEIITDVGKQKLRKFVSLRMRNDHHRHHR